MAFTPLSAKFAVVRFGQAFTVQPGQTYGPAGAIYTITAKKWEVRPTADALDTTNFEGSGFATWLPGIYQADFTIEADWDSVGDPFTNPPNFVIGSYVTNVKLFTNTLNSAFWSFPTALIIETPMSAAVRETISFTFTCKAHGTFVYP